MIVTLNFKSHYCLISHFNFEKKKLFDLLRKNSLFWYISLKMKVSEKFKNIYLLNSTLWKEGKFLELLLVDIRRVPTFNVLSSLLLDNKVLT